MQNDSERNDELEEIVEGFLAFLSGQRNYSAHTVRAYETDVRTYLRYAKRSEFDALAREPLSGGPKSNACKSALWKGLHALIIPARFEDRPHH